jgi:hypothetical protein
MAIPADANSLRGGLEMRHSITRITFPVLHSSFRTQKPNYEQTSQILWLGRGRANKFARTSIISTKKAFKEPGLIAKL